MEECEKTADAKRVSAYLDCEVSLYLADSSALETETKLPGITESDSILAHFKSPLFQHADVEGLSHWIVTKLVEVLKPLSKEQKRQVRGKAHYRMYTDAWAAVISLPWRLVRAFGKMQITVDFNYYRTSFAWKHWVQHKESVCLAKVETTSCKEPQYWGFPNPHTPASIDVIWSEGVREIHFQSLLEQLTQIPNGMPVKIATPDILAPNTDRIIPFTQDEISAMQAAFLSSPAAASGSRLVIETNPLGHQSA